MPNGAKKGGQPTRRRPVLTIKTLEDNLSPITAEISAPTEVSIREVRSRIEEAFKALGTPDLPGTIIPTGQKNNAAEAAEFVLADTLSKLATTRLKAAKEAAEKAGVFGDPKEYVNGDTVMVFSDPNFSINVKKGQPSKMLDRSLVEASAEQFLGKKAQEFMEQSMKERAPTTQIIVSIK